jgi:heat shock protein HslJ
MIPRTAIAFVALSALAFAACGSDSDSASGSTPTADDLAGQAFESTDVTGYDLVEGTTIKLGFETDMVGAQAGCNTQSGGYTITDGALEVSAMLSTMKACDDALMAQDTWLSEFLTSGPDITLDGDTLTLKGSDATISLEAETAPPLEGTTWVLTGTVATEAISSLPADAESTLTITDGQAAINTGCNSGSTTVEITDTTMTFGPIALTRKACPDEITTLENSVLAVFDGEVTYEIVGDNLKIRKDAADGEIGLEYTAQ